MTKAALLVVLVLGCGNVIADPKDGAGGAGGGQAAAGATGGAGELGGRGGAPAGAAGQGGAAGAATVGPCAGLCANPVSQTLTAGTQLVLDYGPGTCFAISLIGPANYAPAASCSPAVNVIELNGVQVYGCNGGEISLESFSSAGAATLDCLLLLPTVPMQTGTLVLR